MSDPDTRPDSETRRGSTSGRPVPYFSAVPSSGGIDPTSPRFDATTLARSDESQSVDGSLFPAGSVLAGRYRLVARLGQGGMGDVYRAEDLKLGESVALKFLPLSLSLDPDTLARFHQEVRLSRQVAHRNVCRVFDIAEADGWSFLTMEYIDGEDLASLLRRIGRLPEAKAIQLARQLCAGLAAAHEVGILHRDLKPSNVMIDGEGRAKISDFGVAHLFDGLKEGMEVAGTPAYMAPEQIQGEVSDVRSDVFALGLVFYEMFTGERPFEAEDLVPMVLRGGRAEPVTPPSDHLPTLDPGIEDLIMAMLDDEPSARPSSALEVAAMLPGGDPLAAALEAGETPSPEMVASAPDRSLLDRRWAWGGVLWVLLLLPLIQWLGQGSLLGMVGAEKPPAVLEDRAQLLLRELGLTAAVVDAVGGYQYEVQRIERLSETLDEPAAWRRRAVQRPMLVTYWYRQAPSSLLPWQVAWSPEPFDPPAGPGEAFVVLDGQGRLERFRLEPAIEERAVSVAEHGSLVESPDWETFYRAAQLDSAAFRPVEGSAATYPSGLPDHDRHWSWSGEAPTGEMLSVSAASLAGEPVFFVVEDPQSMGGDRRPPAKTVIPAGQELLLVTFFTLMGTALVLMYRHWMRRRADRRAAGVLGLTVAAISFVGMVLGAHHPPGTEQFFLLLEILEAAAFRGAAVALVYLALEPTIRRRAPEVLITSTRLLAGRAWDPRVGRDLLAGLALGVGAVAVCALANLTSLAFGSQPLRIYGLSQKLAGFGGAFYWMTFSLFIEVIGSLLLCLLYALLVTWLKKPLPASLGLWLAIAAIGGFQPVVLLAGILFVVALVRFGILATIVTWTCVDWLLFFPAGALPGDWWLPLAALPACVLGVLAIYAGRTAMGTTKQAKMIRTATKYGRSSGGFGVLPGGRESA